MSSVGGIGEGGSQRGQTPVLLIRGDGFVLVGWEKVGPKENKKGGILVVFGLGLVLVY